MTPVRATILTLMPKFVASYTTFGVVKVALRGGQLDLAITDLRDYAVDQRGTVDDKPYGGGDGMVLRPEPIAAAISASHGAAEPAEPKPLVIYSSPKGQPFTTAAAEELAASGRPLCFICGRFAGIDQRIEDRFVDRTYSLGDFVVSGGELPVLMMVDAICRGLPGVLGSPASYRDDSLSEGMGGGLEYPLYTRPEEFEGQRVPEALLSGDHKRIAAWRRQEAERLTQRLRPDLIVPCPDEDS